MSMGILDFSTQSSNQSYTTTITNTDSGNTTLTDTNTLDNVGNLSLNIGDTAGSSWEKYLPLVAIALIVVGIFK